MKTWMCGALLLMGMLLLAGCSACDCGGTTAKTKKPQNDKPALTVKIHRDGGYTLMHGGKAVEVEGGDLLSELRTSNLQANDPVTLIAEPNTSQEHVLHALDALSDLQLKRVTWDFSVTE